MPRKTPRIVRSPAAIRDIVEVADYLARTTSLAAAQRFVAAVEQTLRRLARMPGLGTLWESDKPRLVAVRFAPVGKFRNHLVFYRTLDDGIELIRVLHGARDIEAILGEDE